MATLVLSTVGTLVGGPIGGALGALIGRAIDQTVLFRPKDREGPRLTDLAVQSSQYGSPFAQVHGRVRVAGTVIWATDLTESRIREGGGKGRPGTTRYSYSVSFAVALSSRPISGIGRIWAEGNLLRGADGVFTSDTGFRLHHGFGDQLLDPLIAAAEGVGACPAYRGLAYAVFEDMALEEFGNRIPSLTFEVIGDAGEVDIGAVLSGIDIGTDGSIVMPAVTGLALTAATRREVLQAIATGFPLVLHDSSGALHADWRQGQMASDRTIAATALLPLSPDSDDPFPYRAQRTAPRTDAVVLRYYEPERDYQPGLRRHGTSTSGRMRQIELPMVLTAAAAQQRAEALARAERDGLERIDLRIATLDIATLPGKCVSIEGVPGLWRVLHWRWSADGIDLALASQRPGGAALPLGADPGRSVNTPDGGIGPTRFALFDLPSPMDRPMAHSHIALAVAGPLAGWRGATVYRRKADGDLGDLLDVLRVGATMGRSIGALGAGSPLLCDDLNSLTVQLVRDGPFALVNADDAALSRGANLAMIGSEAIQFARAEPLGDGMFRLSGLWRGRGGTEDAIVGHAADEPFVLITEALGLVDPAQIGVEPGFRAAAQGRDDPEPVLAELASHGRAARPLAPVHGSWRDDGAGGLLVSWVRRSRSGFVWRDGIDVPLGEDSEAYRVAISADGSVIAEFTVPEPAIVFDSATVAGLRAAASVSLLATIVQQGALGLSPPLLVDLPL
ncbi:MAG: phage tail protein [Blastomonas fulva]|uniref:GTA baseplate fiber-binding domain-containing protein n=1 Tax=Blastomonas fulva TaxID=1550728 RepID=UPI0024E1E475|nr:phage tail protein [Blastomonas fulva]MDK2758261.1 phage tail protein [Blastomonas fulva]